jgi:crotonobetainyl-CoA:carnitine CoA-transferase CaiB-like acyl-CoA transferase
MGPHPKRRSIAARMELRLEMTSAAQETFGALAGLKVIDLTQMLAGPFATMLLADHGAVVIKVEPPEGEMTRSVGPYRAGDETRALGAFFQSVNRNKHSVRLDLKSEAGRAAFRALVADADVVVENFRAGVMDRLGLSYETLREVNPRLVYGALRGYGDPRTGSSPYVAWPAFDVIAQAMGGIMSITGPDAETPTKVGPGVGDLIPGALLAFGILAAVRHAQATGEGQFVDVSMLDSILAICERAVWQRSVEGLTPGPEGNHHPIIAPFGMFPAADGFVTVAAQQDSFFPVFCRSIDAPELSADPRFKSQDQRIAHRRDLIQEVGLRTRRFTKAQLMERLGGKVPFGPVLDFGEILESPHFAAREMIVSVEQPGGDPIRVAGVPVKMTATPGRVARRAPLLGEDTYRFLSEAGLSDEEIEALAQRRSERTEGAS